ncbi:hypothetical protein KM043_015582 [Ampulex compressa]|nr:hypothetical protein KM043_015582 [Ampulex compressa]
MSNYKIHSIESSRIFQDPRTKTHGITPSPGARHLEKKAQRRVILADVSASSPARPPPRRRYVTDISNGRNDIDPRARYPTVEHHEVGTPPPNRGTKGGSRHRQSLYCPLFEGVTAPVHPPRRRLPREGAKSGGGEGGAEGGGVEGDEFDSSTRQKTLGDRHGDTQTTSRVLASFERRSAKRQLRRRTLQRGLLPRATSWDGVRG